MQMVKHFCMGLLATVVLSSSMVCSQEGTPTDKLSEAPELLLAPRLAPFPPEAKSRRSSVMAPPPQLSPIAVVVLHKLGESTMGNPSAPLTIVEFFDLRCGYCRAFEAGGMETQLVDKYVLTGKLRIISRELPLSTTRDQLPLYEILRCSSEQKAYWKTRAYLLRSSARGSGIIADLSSELKINSSALSKCVAAKVYERDILHDAAQARLAGVRGTPSFVVGPTKDDVISGPLLEGADDPAAFFRHIDEALVGEPVTAR